MPNSKEKPEIIGAWLGTAMDEAEAFIAAREMPGSLNGASVRPLCADHQPVADLVEIEGVQLVQVRCPKCSFCMTVGLQTYREMMAEDDGAEPEPIDILKFAGEEGKLK